MTLTGRVLASIKINLIHYETADTSSEVVGLWCDWLLLANELLLCSKRQKWWRPKKTWTTHLGVEGCEMSHLQELKQKCCYEPLSQYFHEMQSSPKEDINSDRRLNQILAISWTIVFDWDYVSRVDMRWSRYETEIRILGPTSASID